MSSRHLPRQPDRDVRMHDPPPQQHNIQHPQHPPPHVVHLNGNSNINIPTNGATISPSTNPTVVPNGAPATSTSSVIHKLNVANEQTWLLIGRVAEQLGDLDKASIAYDHALRHNPHSLSGLTQIAGIARIKEDYPKAVDYFQRVLKQQEENGEVWSALGHCYLMQDDLQKAYSAYQQALYLLPNPKEDPKLWYGIGILYDRYGSLDHAEEAFSSVLRMDKDLDFDRANEILFRLGIIYKQQQKYEDSLACFDRILRNPPSPLAHADIWFQIGHVFEQQKDHSRAKDAYERVVADNPGHGKVLQQLGWLYHQDGTSFQNQDLAITYLTKSLEAEPADAQSWYLLGRAYMAGQKYNKAYEAYQQAVYRDGRNPTFWCSIGVLYFQINQFRDALDAYSRAIRINPYISEVWFDLGSLYESCNNQITDAIDAYARASELDPSNPAITQRLQLLKTAQATGGQLPAAPGPQDVHPTAYTSATVPPTGLNGPPLLLQSANHRPAFRADSGPMNEISLPPPSQVHKSPPFGGRAPPPVVLDESRHPSNNLLGPMEVDRPRDYPGPLSREPASRGPVGHQSLLLQQPVQHQPGPSEEFRNGSHSHHQESFFTRPPPRQQHSRSASPAPHNRVRSPPPPFQAYPAPRQASGPAQPSRVSVQRSPRTYPANTESSRPVEQEGGWNRRPTPTEVRDWDQDMERRSGHEYSSHPPPPPSNFYPPRSPGPPTRRDHSPPAPSPRTHPARYWEGKPVSSASRGSPPPPPAPSHQESSGRRYDPRYDGRESRDYEVNETRSFAGSPEGTRNPSRNPPPHLHVNTRESESPAPGVDSKDRRRRPMKDKEPEQMPLQPQPQPPQPTVSLMQESAPKKERKKRLATKRGGKDEPMGSETPKMFVAERGPSMPGNYKHGHGYPKGPGSPEPSSSNGSGSSRSVQPSPTSATARPPSRVVDEDYDEGVDALMGLASYRGGADMPRSNEGASRSPPVSTGSRHSVPSPRPHTSHRNSVSSTRSHASPPTSAVNLKRTLSPGSEESDTKRSRLDNLKRRSSPSGGRRTPVQSTRPSPIPFRTQPASHSPEARQHEPYPPSSPLPVVLPPHPRPIGAGHSQAHMGGSGGGSAPIALPPIATLSPPSTAASPSERGRDERMQVDSKRSTSNSPSTRGKMSDSGRPSSRSPSSKHAASPGSDKKESS